MTPTSTDHYISCIVKMLLDKPADLTTLSCGCINTISDYSDSQFEKAMTWLLCCEVVEHNYNDVNGYYYLNKVNS